MKCCNLKQAMTFRFVYMFQNHCIVCHTVRSSGGGGGGGGGYRRDDYDGDNGADRPASGSP